MYMSDSLHHGNTVTYSRWGGQIYMWGEMHRQGHCRIFPNQTYCDVSYAGRCDRQWSKWLMMSLVLLLFISNLQISDKDENLLKY